ncbi:S1/P1 Nuclease [Pseudoalteromonas luteoviolacea]|uniref:S1/P1 Nuclease n=1 Tax=Pseudoalteromonas luteoviolacea TaxID=43657 RepID=A0A0C1Q8A4_9GAMM|nr:S1/P1 nuclease [Pseudoalteromonas luteoviolacea]KID55725.1 S1/P1 Nuclease [Pseudoalteromonas luteoviolacea]
MFRSSITVLALSTCLMSSSAFAWGQNGHRVIGELAQNNLSHTAMSQVQLLLGDDSLAEVSTWPDEMRSSPSPFWKKQSGKWHYINIDDPSQMHRYDNGSIEHKHEVKHILDGINYAVNVLKSTSSTHEDKQFALKFLVHLVGDAHQPFHAGRAEDLGGNKIEVEFFGKSTNLHKVFDTELVEHQKLSYTEFTRSVTTSNKQLIANYLNSSPADWLLESNKIAEEIYKSNETEISWSYIYKYTPTIKQRLQQGGYRLAGLLNQIFDTQSKPLINALATNKSFEK